MSNKIMMCFLHIVVIGAVLLRDEDWLILDTASDTICHKYARDNIII